MGSRRLYVSFCCLFLLAFGLLIAAPMGTSIGDSPSHHAQQTGDVEIDPDIADGEGEQTVVVRLESPPDQAVAAHENHRAAMQSHAADTQRAFERFADGNPHVKIERQFWIANAILVTVDTDRVPLERLGMVDNVTGVHENFEVEAVGGTVADGSSLESDNATSTAASPAGDVESTSNGDTTYGLEQIRAAETWERFDTRGDEVRVAVLDTGIDADHADLQLAENGWAEFDSDGNRVYSEPYDSGYHGTHVSGTVAGGDASGTSIGVAPDVELYHGKVLGANGGTFSQVTAGMEWAVESDADVVSMSLGGGERIDAYVEHVENAHRAGSLVVAASGNDGEGTSGSPGDVYDVLSVGATDESDDVADFSSGELVEKDEWYDPGESWPDEYVVPDVVAPGDSVLSAHPDYDWAYANGTSMATPHVSGAIALLLSTTDEDPSPTEIRDLFRDTAVDIGADETRQGQGRTDAYEAVRSHSFDTLEPDFTPETAYTSETTTITVDVDHPVERYEWAVDGETVADADGSEIEYDFAEPGPIEVSVTIDDGHETATESTTIDVVDDSPPNAVLEAPEKVATGTNATFDASESTDNHAIEQYEWAFGDGHAVNTSDPVVTHWYDDPGDYDVSLTVRDPSGNTNTTGATVAVQDPATVEHITERTATNESNATIEYALEHTDGWNAGALEYRVVDADDPESDPAVDWTEGPFESTADRTSFELHTGDLEDGNYTVTLRLVDDDGDALPFDDATDEVALEVKTTLPALDLDVRPDDDAFSAFGLENPAIANVTTTDHRHESTTVEVTNATGDVVADWGLSSETGDGETATIEWPNDATDGLESGDYTLLATASDDLGNERSLEEPITVDADRPNVSVESIGGGIERDGTVYANESTELEIVVAADDGRPNLEADENASVENLWVELDATFTTYLEATEVHRIDETTWRATLEDGSLPDEGEYHVRAGAIDAAKNANETVASESVVVDRTAPRLGVAITDYDEGVANVSVRSDEPLADEPTVGVVGPDGEVALEDLEADAETETRWIGSFTAEPGNSYELAATSTDLAGNAGTDAANATIHDATVENGTVTVRDVGAGAFTTIELEDDAAIDETVVATSGTDAAPHGLEADATGVSFLTTLLGPDFEGAVANATIGFEADGDRLPDGVTIDDDRIALQHHDGSTDGWGVRDLTLREFDSTTDAPVEGEYWTATVEEFSTYGVTVTDDDPPELVGSEPADGATLEADTETVTIELEYADALSGVDPSSIAFSVDGENVTTHDRTQLTSNWAEHRDYPVEPGQTVAVELELADDAGNDAVLETTFDVATADDDDDDDDDGGGGGLGGFSPPGDGEDDQPRPTAEIDVDPDPAAVGEEITFDGAGSSADRTITDYVWTIDGETFEGETVTTAFDEPGTYEVELVVSTAVADSEPATATVTVEDAPDDEESPDDDPGHEPDDDGIPGFGVVVGIVALGSVIALLGRRRNR